MGRAIEELAHFIAGTPWEAIPKSVREHAKLVLLDTVGVILDGSVQPEVAGVRARLTATSSHWRNNRTSRASTSRRIGSPPTCGSPPDQLLRGEVLAPARGGCADSPRKRGVSRVHRRSGSRSRDRGDPPESRCSRGPCAQRQRAATQASTGDRHAHRWASGHTAARKRTRRLPGTLSRRRSSGEVSRAGGCGAQPRRRHSRGGTRRATR